METIGKALLEAIEKLPNKIGVAFSGGIDSTLLAFACKKLNKKFTLYTVGLQGSKDMDWAAKVALSMNFPLKIKLITDSEATETITEVVRILKTDDPIYVGVGSMTYSVEKFAKEDNTKTLLFGLGADEAFAGYNGHRKAMEKGEVHQECERRIAGVSKDVERDTKISEEIGIEAAMPFLDEKLLEAAMKIKPEEKINETQKKIILRKLAVSWELPEELAQRPKTAAQYGSGFDKFMEKAAKKNGYENKGAYLASFLSDEFEP